MTELGKFSNEYKFFYSFSKKYMKIFEESLEVSHIYLNQLLSLTFLRNDKNTLPLWEVCLFFTFFSPNLVILILMKKTI